MTKKYCQPILIVGSKNSGKTKYLQYIFEKLTKHDLKVGGFLCITEQNNFTKDCYYLYNLREKTKLLFATKEDSKWPIRYGDYFFNPDAFKYGNQIIKSNLHADIIIFDEYGPLEEKGEGFSESFNYLLENYEGVLYISIRPSLLSHLKGLIVSLKVQKQSIQSKWK